MTTAEQDTVYLDHNATTLIRPKVIAAMSETMATVGNASSVHAAGRRARERVETARAQVARLVGAKPANVIFTSGGTEADNLALRGFGKRHLLVSAVEHGAVLAPSLLIDPEAVILPVDGDGRVDPRAVEQALQAVDGPALVSVMLANNETGVIEPVREIAEIAHRHDALVHCDAVQGAGKIRIDIEDLGVDMLSLSAHKLGGPQGIGALVLRSDLPVDAQIVGGGQEHGRRSGTENVAGAVGFGVAAEEALAGLAHMAELAELRDEMERRIGEIAPERKVFGAGVPRLPNTSCLTMPGVKAETQVMAFDLEGIALSAGSACSSGKVAASHVLEAMEVEQEVALTAIRVSLGWCTTAQDVDRFVRAWEAIYRRCRSQADAA
jgi:cysteine desulfurase